mgnify:CR=1 FL=1
MREDIARQDSAGRALGRLARTFPAQMEALNRYRNNGEPAITVQNVSVQDGGKAIVGNVTQHASVIVSDKDPAPAVTDARMVSMPDRGAQEHDPDGRQAGSTRHERSRPQYRSDAGEPALRRKIRSGGSCRSPAVRGKRRCRMHGGAPGSGAPRANQNARRHGLFTQGRDRRAQADSGLAGLKRGSCCKEMK